MKLSEFKDIPKLLYQAIQDWVAETGYTVILDKQDDLYVFRKPATEEIDYITKYLEMDKELCGNGVRDLFDLYTAKFVVYEEQILVKVEYALKGFTWERVECSSNVLEVLNINLSLLELMSAKLDLCEGVIFSPN